MNGQQVQNQNQSPVQVQIKMPDEILKGAYANQAVIAHNKEEFVVNFINIDLLSPNGIVSARVILSPGHMKRVVAAMQENLKNYEKSFGQIKEADAPSHKIGFQAE